MKQIDCYGFETTSEYFKLKKIDTSGDSSGSARYRIVTRVPCRMKVGPSSDTSRVTVGFNDTTHCPDWTVHRLRAEQLNGAKPPPQRICGITEEAVAKPVDAIVPIASKWKNPSLSDAFETNASTCNGGFATASKMNER